MTTERRTRKEKMLLAGVALRVMLADYHLNQLLSGPGNEKLTHMQRELFKLGFRKGVEYMDIRKPVA